MSDITRCPHCHKYIDTTFAVDKCPKCGGLLTDSNFSGGGTPTSENITDPNSRIKDVLVLGGSLAVVFLITYILSPGGNSVNDLARTVGALAFYAVLLLIGFVAAYKLAKGEPSWRILYVIGTIAFIWLVFKDKFSRFFH